MLDANAYFPRSLIDNLLTIITPNERRVTHIDNLYLFHSDRPYVEYDGSIKGCGISIVLQGQTQMCIGNAYHQRNVGQVIAFSADLPVRALICNVSASEPFLSAELRFDPQILHTVMTELPPTKGVHHPHGVMLIDLDEPLKQAFIRLLELTHQPPQPYLANLLQQEIMYRLLSQQMGLPLYQALIMHTQSKKVAKAVRWLETNYQQSVKVSELADYCGMSVSGFFWHFKKMTTLSPLQYQKKLRLENAQKLIALGHQSISTIAYQVGYKSVSQFCREYVRYFGVKPTQDER